MLAAPIFQGYIVENYLNTDLAFTVVRVIPFLPYQEAGQNLMQVLS